MMEKAAKKFENALNGLYKYDLSDDDSDHGHTNVISYDLYEEFQVQ